MAEPATDAGRENRSKVAGTRVTPEEKRRIEIVAGLRNTTVSKLLRVMSVEEVLEEYRVKSAEAV